MNEIFTKYVTLLYDLFVYDVEVMSQAWMYWCLMIPICCYAAFFLVKWSLLTAPLWLPIYLALDGVVKVKKVFKRD